MKTKKIKCYYCKEKKQCINLFIYKKEESYTYFYACLDCINKIEEELMNILGNIYVKPNKL